MLEKVLIVGAGGFAFGTAAGVGVAYAILSRKKALQEVYAYTLSDESPCDCGCDGQCSCCPVDASKKNPKEAGNSTAE